MHVLDTPFTKKKKIYATSLSKCQFILTLSSRMFSHQYSICYLGNRRWEHSEQCFNRTSRKENTDMDHNTDMVNQQTIILPNTHGTPNRMPKYNIRSIHPYNIHYHTKPVGCC